jgi:hypothetical protein
MLARTVDAATVTILTDGFTDPDWIRNGIWGGRPGKPKNGNGQVRGWQAAAGWFRLVAVR